MERLADYSGATYPCVRWGEQGRVVAARPPPESNMTDEESEMCSSSDCPIRSNRLYKLNLDDPEPYRIWLRD